MDRTALVVEVAEAEELVRAIRAEHDPIASRGMPAHITVLYPFVPPAQLDAVMGRLRTVLEPVEPFDYSLENLDAFPEAVWLRPFPDAPFKALTRSVWTEFPDYPPYEGRFPDSQPHLTLGLIDGDASRATIRSAAERSLVPRLPISCRCVAVSAFTSASSGDWARFRTLPLGPRESAQR